MASFTRFVSRKYTAIIGLAFGFLVPTIGKSYNVSDSLLEKQQYLLRGIGSILEKAHYDPKPIDDSLSANVFKNYIEQLDFEKNLFTQMDLASLSKYKYQIDDEINGTAFIGFYPAAIKILNLRLQSAKKIYTKILESPFDFNKDELYQPNRDSVDYPTDDKASYEAWHQRLKYRVLIAYNELLTQRTAAKAADSLKKKTDLQLQQMARKQVKGYYDRYFSTRFNPKVFDPTQQFSLFVNTITHEMDPHTDYFAPVDARDFNEDMSNSFYGIGALLGNKDGQVYIDEVMAGGAAWKSKKVAKGDVILKIGIPGKEPVDIAGYTITDAVKLMRGTKGSTVDLVIKKASTGLVEKISLVREEVKLDQATAKSAIIKSGDNKIGYINLPSFYVDFQNSKNPSSSEDIATELKKLNTANIDGLIVDVRGNPGGSLPDVNKIIGYFVPNGPAVQVRNRSGQSAPLMDQNTVDSVLYKGPLIVMASESSASASEIFAAAMKDYNRGLIVGSTSTYGKGTVQRMLPLGNIDSTTGGPEFGSLKMTIEKFYGIDGGSNQRKGVISDIVIPDPDEVTIKREKDEPTALPWDKIDSAKYSDYSIGYNKDSVVQKALARIDTNSQFNLIKLANIWLRDNWNAPISLNLKKYQERQDYIKSLFGKSIARDSTTFLSVATLPEDYNKFYKNPDAVKQKWYQEWLKGVSQDIYIKENIKIIQDMLPKKTVPNVAKS